jgi:hypothetical protein
MDIGRWELGMATATSPPGRESGCRECSSDSGAGLVAPRRLGRQVGRGFSNSGLSAPHDVARWPGCGLRSRLTDAADSEMLNASRCDHDEAHEPGWGWQWGQTGTTTLRPGAGVMATVVRVARKGCTAGARDAERAPTN